jgi:hypothetical protein
MKIIVNSIEFIADNWAERQQLETHTPAGISSEAQRVLDAEASRRNPMHQVGDVSFECAMALDVGTSFSVKEDGRKFIVAMSRGKKHWANLSSV